MRDVRIFYHKSGPLRFVSHLDMNRYLPRLIRRAGLPVWYTQGYHQHVYLTFALPLSLGYASEYEVVDLRLTQDEFPLQEICRRLNACAVDGFAAFRAAEPKYKPAQLGYCRYRIDFLASVDQDALRAFLQSAPIFVEKRNKKGGYKAVDIAPKIESFTVSGNCLTITLAAGNDNVNPALLLQAFFEKQPEADYTVTREMLFTTAMEQFE